MKILHLRFKNLNSLVGEWGIDFTTPEFAASGIFAITGPTGAGKSTILDAICLALYGRTPRLKAISKSTNEIMSRQSGECFSEVTFATRAGEFRCHWSQHRAHKKANGKLAESKHEISDASNGKVLESKKREVAIAVEKKTGMDFDRFTRSMLLAQGGFAAFLQALPDDRAPILEQLTGTEIYSEISKLIHERQRDEHATLEILRAETAGLTILSDEVETTLREELSRQQTRENELSSRDEALKKSILWHNQIATLKNELSAINHEAKISKNNLMAFTKEREKLQLALKATELESEYATLMSKREQQKNDLEVLARIKTQLPTQETALKVQETALKESEDFLATFKIELRDEIQLIKRVRELDLLITGKITTLKNAENDCHKLEGQLFEKKELQQKNISELTSAKAKLTLIDEYLATNNHAATLLTELTGINEQLKNLKNENRNLSAIKSNSAKLKQQAESDHSQLQKKQRSCQELQNNYTSAQKQTSQTEVALAKLLGERLLREYRAEYAGCLKEMAYLKKIENLENERLKLKENSPCPLCGSRHHPFAEKSPLITDANEEKMAHLNTLIERAEELENKLKKDEITTRNAESACIEAEKLYIHARHKKEESQNSLQRLENELEIVLEKYKKIKDSLIQRLKPFAINEIQDNNLDDITALLSKKLKKWQGYQKEKGDLENSATNLAATIKSLETITGSLNESLKERENSLKNDKEEHVELKKRRQDLYGNRDPNETERQLEKRLLGAETALTKTRARRDQSKAKLNDLKTRITTLDENLAQITPTLDRLEPTFTANYKRAGFKDEQDFISCRLSNAERDYLSQQEKKLNDKQSDIEARKKDREKRLVAETAKEITTQPLNDLKNEQSAVHETLKNMAEEVGALKEKLSNNTNAKNKHKQQLSLINKQKKECTRWESLHALIGSADGKKFRNFAQGLTFQLMVSHANLQLQKMSDRYLLVRDHKQPLELNVIDNYQASETRSTKNLSGGESFIVSLSLALGLAKMASQNVRVDSLFLDEGFGTLDEDALETALETLATLQEEGKLIGIISHVGALKERIATQITVQPLSGGKSTIRGPGCQRLTV